MVTEGIGQIPVLGQIHFYATDHEVGLKPNGDLIGIVTHPDGHGLFVLEHTPALDNGLKFQTTNPFPFDLKSFLSLKLQFEGEQLMIEEHGDLNDVPLFDTCGVKAAGLVKGA